jgi:type IV pilus assembly protein PilW
MIKKIPNTHIRQQFGLSLIELVIAMALGLVITVGVLQVLSGTQETERYTRAVGSLEDASRIAMQLITNDFQMGSYYGCVDPEKSPPRVIANGAPVNAAGFTQRAVEGWEFSTSWSGSSTTNPTPSGSSPIANSDVFRVLRASSGKMELANDVPVGGPVELVDGSLSFSDDDLVLITDCENSDLFRVSSVTDAAVGPPATPLTLTFTSADNTPASLSVEYSDAFAEVLRFFSRLYFVADTGRDDVQGNDIFALYRSEQGGTPLEMVEGIDNMQIRYGTEVSGGNINYRDADAVSDFADVDFVQVSLLVSSDPVLLDPDTSSYAVTGGYIEPDTATGSAPKYNSNRRIRRTFTRTIDLRNRTDDL